MRLFRFLAVLLYVGYLTQVGLLFVVVPWSDGWAALILKAHPAVSWWLAEPFVRGALTGFGVLHFVLLLLEAAAFEARRASREAD